MTGSAGTTGRAALTVLVLVAQAMGVSRASARPQDAAGGAQDAADVARERSTRLPREPLARGTEVRHAIAVEPLPLFGSLLSPLPLDDPLPVGTILRYQGEITDTFERTWSILVDEGFLQRVVLTVAAPFTEEEYRAYDGPAAFLDIVPAVALVKAQVGSSPATVATVPEPDPAAPIGIAEDWWRGAVRAVGLEHQPAFGETLAIEAFGVPGEIAAEWLELIGGNDALDGWPDDPLPGQLHFPELLPLAFVYDGRGNWEPIDPPRTHWPMASLLANASLQQDPRAPRVTGGTPPSCWRVVGNLDPRGAAVGATSMASALEIPDLDDLAGRADRLGRRDFVSLLSADGESWRALPRRLSPAAPAGGTRLQDNTRRQAVFLEQELPPAITRRIRGRSMSLRVTARMPAQEEGGATTMIGLEVRAGAERFASGPSVGRAPSTVSLDFDVPLDAEHITVRLLPLDPSIAVQEQGDVIFEHASLVPAEWPTFLAPRPFVLQLAEIVFYRPANRFARAELVVSDRTPEALAAAWGEITDARWNEEIRGAVLAGDLLRGMRPRQVRAAWGEPTSETGLPGARVRWDWPGRSAAFDDVGLISWTQQGPPREGMWKRCWPEAPAHGDEGDG